MRAPTFFLPLSFLLLAKAQNFPNFSSYAQKCPRFDNKEGPIVGGKKATYQCGAYPTTANFTPVPNIQNSDACALACETDASCEAATWSEIFGTEYECHKVKDWNGSLDETAALVMTIKRPIPATAQDNYGWNCPANPPQKFLPPDLAVTYHCDHALQGESIWDIHTALDPDSCILACKDKTDSGTPCSGSIWTMHKVPSCQVIAGGGSLIPVPGLLTMEYEVVPSHMLNPPQPPPSTCPCCNSCPSDGDDENRIPYVPDGDDENRIPYVPGGDDGNQIPLVP